MTDEIHPEDQDQESVKAGKLHRASSSAEIETNPTLSAVQPIGSWQCPKCFLASMYTWRGSPNPDNAPTCCGGEVMLPYRIPSNQRF